MIRFYLSDEATQKGVLPLAAPRPGDAGYDLRSMEDLTIAPNTQVLVRTGLHVAIPEGWVGLLRDRSSFAGRRLYVHSGVIDAAYRGEVLVVLENAGSEPFRIQVNDRIAQMVVVPHFAGPAQQMATLSALGETERGAAGFGSTGVQ